MQQSPSLDCHNSESLNFCSICESTDVGLHDMHEWRKEGGRFGQHLVTEQNSSELSESERVFGQKKALKAQKQALWMVSESPLKASWLLLKALRKQNDFCWKLYQSGMTFVESSMKAFQKAQTSQTVWCPSFWRKPWPFGDHIVSQLLPPWKESLKSDICGNFEKL